MNCQDVSNLLDEHGLRGLSSWQRDEIDAHLLDCDACGSEWRALAALRRLESGPKPSPRSGLFTETMQLAVQSPARSTQRSFWLGAGVGGAIAASIALAFVTLNPALRSDSSAGRPAVAIALNEARDVGVSIDSARPLVGAAVRVALTGGVRLVGFEDRSSLSWRTDLDRGINRLTLPLIATSPDGGQVVVEVEHENKRRVFVVEVSVDSDGALTRAAPIRVDPANIA